MIKWEGFIDKYKNHIVAKIFGYIFLGIAFYVVGQVSIGFDHLRPLGVAVLLPVLVCKTNTLIVCIMFLVANTLAGFTPEHLYISLNVVIVGYLAILLHQKIKKDMGIWIYLYAVLSQVAFVVLNLGTSKECLAVILGVVISMVLLACVDNFLTATIKRGFNTKLNLDEQICGGIVLVVFSLGLSHLNFDGWEMIKIFAPFVILVSTYLFTSSTTLISSALMGVGYAIFSFDVTYVSIFICYAILSLAFKSTYKILSPIAIVLLEIAFGLYFKIYPSFSYPSIICVGIAGLLFFLLPKVVLDVIKDMLGGMREKLAIRNIVNRSKEGIYRRMNEISNVFGEMDSVFRDMVKGNLSEDDAKEMLISELNEKVCKSCPDYAKCMRMNSEYMSKVFGGMVESGLDKGRCTLLDVPQYLSSKCGRLNILLNTLNQMLKNYKNYSNMVSNMDASRVLIAEQLGGISMILKKLGEEVKHNITFDTHQENTIIEELSYKNIVCVEALVYEENDVSKKVVLLVKGEFDEKVLEKIVGKVCNLKMNIDSVASANIPNTRLVTLLTSPNFDLVFGSSSYSKKGIFKNGDAHSLIKIDNGRFMIALCDGMGSGEKAKKVSNLSISLIENFYKAGFDNDTILSSVNKLLCLNGEENFTAVDLCILDFHNNTSDFIKLGATYGLIKKQECVEVIESSGLPIGVLEEIRPHITKKMVSEWDNIILMSDGVTDAFGNIENLQEFVGSLTTLNPQTMSEEIIDRAVDLNNGVCKDDMTVLVARVFAKI